jgi:polyhydroxyalkanoate synthesis regulator phasin
MEAEMNQFTFAKQMLDFNRTTFANTVGAMSLFQEQSEKMMTAFVEQADWIPAEGKKAISDMSAMLRKTCSEFKKAVDENFVRAEALFKGADQTQAQ